MPLTHTAPALTLSATDEASLRRVAKSHTTAHRSALRARALLLAYEGVANNEIARRVGVNPNSVRAWRQRFEDEGLVSIGRIAPGRGRKPSLPEGTVAEVVRLTMHEQPPTARPSGQRGRWPSARALVTTRWRASGRTTN